MFQVINPALGSPQITVQQTQADWAKFLGRDGGTVPGMRPGYKVEAYDGIFGQATFILAYGVASNVIGAAVRIGAGYATTLAAASGAGPYRFAATCRPTPTRRRCPGTASRASAR